MEVGRGKTMQTIVTIGRNVPPRVRRQQLLGLQWNEWLLLLLLSRFSRVQLCDPTDGSLPGSAIPGILQARTLEWVAISFSNA